MRKKTMSLRGKKSLKILGGATPPTPQKNHSGGGRETLRHPPVFAPGEGGKIGHATQICLKSAHARNIVTICDLVSYIGIYKYNFNLE